MAWLQNESLHDAIDSSRAGRKSSPKKTQTSEEHVQFIRGEEDGAEEDCTSSPASSDYFQIGADSYGS
jgi:hypothetical protein